jgi:hypothetical protein
MLLLRKGSFVAFAFPMLVACAQAKWTHATKDEQDF